MKRIQFSLFGLLLLATVSCSDERLIIENNRTDGSERSVMLRLALPGIAAPNMGTRAIGQEQEVAIETLDILAFKVENGVETFLYHSLATKSAGNTGNSSLQTYNATIFVKSFQQRFVIITNARTKIQTLIGSRIDGWVGQEKEGVLSKLTVDFNGGDRWNAMSASNFTAIPMWGETAPKMIDLNTTTISETTIPLMRMVAKIEVQLDQSVQGLTDIFKLKSVHLYNTNTTGRIVPKPGAEYVGTDIIARKASLPAAVHSVVGPLAYYDFSAPGSFNVAMKGAIYLFETAAKNAGNFLEETCIVVGGLYGTDSQESYYRLDFFAPDGTTHLDMLRNNRYICNIESVKRRGYPTVDDAYRAKSFNLEADILVWNEGVIRDVVIEGQYMLGVSHGRFDFDVNVHNSTHTDNILKVITDNPTGWTATVWGNKAGTTPVPNDVVSGQPWLSITPTSGTGNAQPDDMHVLANANSTNFMRTAYIHITAGRLTYLVTVTQAGNLNSISGSGTPASTRTYVGAFWKAAQKGERIIRIYDAPAGSWTAAVAWYDSQWTPGSDGIILAAGGSSDPGITWNTATEAPADMNNPSNDVLYSVPGAATSVSGTVAAGGDILFRIGLQKPYADGMNNLSANPARYAVVLISYENNTKYQKIFIRQGEGNDYAPGQSSGARWSPYNLGNTDNRSEYGVGGFVDYPTKAGYFYQWGYSTTLTAPVPRHPVNASLPNWVTAVNGTFSLTSASPSSDYTIPTEAQIKVIRDNREYSAFGYYADGHFDRRQIGNEQGTSPKPNSAVSASNANVAYNGRLFFNTTTNASLFFPAAGFRFHANSSTTLTGGPLNNAGGDGMYLVKDAGTKFLDFWSGTGTNVAEINAYPTTSNGFSVRCVHQ